MGPVNVAAPGLLQFTWLNWKMPSVVLLVKSIPAKTSGSPAGGAVAPLRLAGRMVLYVLATDPANSTDCGRPPASIVLRSKAHTAGFPEDAKMLVNRLAER